MANEQQRTVLQVWGMAAVAVHTPPAKVKPTTTVNDDLICGVELEIENLHAGQGWYMDHAGRAWSVVEDGSLRPRGLAWEFVSKPMKLGYVLTEMTDLFRNIGVTDANYSDRCSVHIHTNVQDFTQEQLASLSLVYPVFEEVLFQYVNHHKKQEEQGYCRDTNLYCIPWSACRMNRKFVTNLFNNVTHTHHSWQKYTALNLLPVGEKGTVEWRHMHGTCDMEKLTTWFNIIGAIMRYAKNKPFSEIVAAIKVMNDVSTYKQFFEEVLLNTLAYDEQYRKLLREGVVNAKYSLLNWETEKDKPKDKKRNSLLGDYEVQWEPDAAVAGALGLDDRARIRTGIQPGRPRVINTGAQIQAAAARLYGDNPTQWFTAADLNNPLDQAIRQAPEPQPAPVPTAEQLAAAQQFVEENRARREAELREIRANRERADRARVRR